MTLAIILVCIFGFLKASTDRTLWGSAPNDGADLWLDDWAWFQAWKKGKMTLLPWVPIDAWHFLDSIKVIVGFFAGVSFYIHSGPLEWYEWCFVAGSAWTIAQTTKWLFYEILFWKNPLDGFRNWKEKWFT